MGHTKIAGMPVITGLYTILLPVLAFAVFGSSRHLVVGADRSPLLPEAGGRAARQRRALVDSALAGPEVVPDERDLVPVLRPDRAATVAEVGGQRHGLARDADLYHVDVEVAVLAAVPGERDLVAEGGDCRLDRIPAQGGEPDRGQHRVRRRAAPLFLG